MKNVIRYVSVLIGALLISLSLNFLIIPNNIVPFGVHGISTMLYYINGINPAINILIINICILLFSSMFINKDIIRYYLLPSLIIPICVFITSPLTKYFSIELPEMMLVLIVAGVLTGYGYGLMYKQGYSAGSIFLLEEVIGKLTRFHSRIYSWILDIITLCILFVTSGFQITLYSLVVIVITKYMITKERFGINDSKMFYIITSKYEKVRHFILHDLKYELTVLDVTGGYSKKDNKILLSVISKNDYYRLKQGVKIIDPDAFIAITDTYDVVNRKSF